VEGYSAVSRQDRNPRVARSLGTPDRYLDRAMAQTPRLMLRADKIGGAWYVPHPFDFYLQEMRTTRWPPGWCRRPAPAYRRIRIKGQPVVAGSDIRIAGRRA
jgi:hypothetical protein